MSAYIIIIITFISLGVLSFIKGVKEGIIASIGGTIVTAIIGIVHFFINKISGLFSAYEITMQDFFKWLLFIGVSIILFIILCFIIKVNGGGHNKKVKRTSKAWKK